MADHRCDTAVLGFGLLLQQQLQLRVDLQLPREVIQVVAFGFLLVIDQQHTGHVHLGRHCRVFGKLGKIRRIQGLGDFGVEPLLQLWVVGMSEYFIRDQLLLFFFDLAVGLRGRDQCTQDRVAVGFGFGAVELVDGLECRLWLGGLLALPGLIRLESHHSQGGQRRIVHPASTPLGPTTTPDNLALLFAADPNPGAAFTTYTVPAPADSAATTEPPVLIASATATTAELMTDTESVNCPAGFLVQAGSFIDTDNARTVQARIKSLLPDLSVNISQDLLNGRQRSRVLVGNFGDRPEAEAVRQQLLVWGIGGMVREVALR